MKRQPGPWYKKPVGTIPGYVFIQRKGANGKIEHLTYASDGSPMWWGEKRADKELVKLKEAV